MLKMLQRQLRSVQRLHPSARLDAKYIVLLEFDDRGRSQTVEWKRYQTAMKAPLIIFERPLKEFAVMCVRLPLCWLT
jgi:hypothetical protein